MPEPITVASKKAVPINSAAIFRAIYAFSRVMLVFIFPMSSSRRWSERLSNAASGKLMKMPMRCYLSRRRLE